MQMPAHEERPSNGRNAADAQHRQTTSGGEPDTLRGAGPSLFGDGIRRRGANSDHREATSTFTVGTSSSSTAVLSSKPESKSLPSTTIVDPDGGETNNSTANGTNVEDKELISNSNAALGVCTEPNAHPQTLSTKSDANPENITNKGKEKDFAVGGGEDSESGHGGSGSEEFSCNICFDTASEPVLTVCGHLFCWPCLAQWLERSLSCPVCKAGCDKEKAIPVYGRGKEERDPRKNPTVPLRPTGQRPPQQPGNNQPFFGFEPFIGGSGFHTHLGGGGMTMNFGFGLFPALMGMSYVYQVPNNVGNTGAQAVGQAGNTFVWRLFMMLATLVFITILFF